MKNLIKNSSWCQCDDKGPLYFSGKGTTYDNFCVGGCQTCSITQNCDMCGYDQYDCDIKVCWEKQITFSYMIRAVEANCVFLQAEFYDECDNLICGKRKDISCGIKGCFTKQEACFNIPKCTEHIRLSLHFEGKTTACTFFAPAAYFC